MKNHLSSFLQVNEPAYVSVLHYPALDNTDWRGQEILSIHVGELTIYGPCGIVAAIVDSLTRQVAAVMAEIEAIEPATTGEAAINA